MYRDIMINVLFNPEPPVNSSQVRRSDIGWLPNVPAHHPSDGFLDTDDSRHPRYVCFQSEQQDYAAQTPKVSSSWNNIPNTLLPYLCGCCFFPKAVFTCSHWWFVFLRQVHGTRLSSDWYLLQKNILNFRSHQNPDWLYSNLWTSCPNTPRLRFDMLG